MGSILNSAVHETADESPAKLHRKLRSQRSKPFPDTFGYGVVKQIKDLQNKTYIASKKVKARQLRNYNKSTTDVALLPKDRVWVLNHPQYSKAK